MRHRRWVVVLAILIIAVLPLSFLGLKVASRRPAVKRVVLSRIMPEVAGELTIGGLEMGLASLHFTDIVLRLEGGCYVLIPSAAVSVSLPRLIAGGLIPQRSLSTIIISDPTVVISYGRDGAEETSPGSPFDVTTLEGYLPDYLGVSGASVVFRDERTTRTLTIDSIDLLLERDGEGPVVGGASGNCCGGEGNFEAQFTWNGSLQTLAVDGTLSDVLLDERLPVPPSVPLEFRHGAMSATFQASVSPDTVRGLDLGFAVDGAVVSVTTLGETLRGVDARGRLRGGAATLESASGSWRSASWSVSGSASDAGVMEDIRLTASGVPLAQVADLLELSEARIDGNVDVSARVTGRFEDPVAVVEISAGDVGVGDIALTDASGVVTLTRDGVATEGLEARVFGGSASIAGALERDGPGEQWRFEFGADARGLDVGLLMAASSGDTTARGRISLTDIAGNGTLDRPDLESLMSWEDVSLGTVRLGSGAGGFILSSGDLSASLGSSDRTCVASCLVENLFDAPAVGGEVVLSGVSVESLLPTLQTALFPITLTGVVDVAGPADSLSIAGEVSTECDFAHATVRLAGSLTPTKAGGGGGLRLALDSPDAAVRGIATPLTAHLSVDGSELSLRDARLGDFAEANVRVGLTGERSLNAGLVVSEAGLSSILTGVLGEAPDGVSGLVFASVSVHGTVPAPVATAQVTVGAASLAGVSGLDASAVGRFEEGIVTLSEFTLRESGRPVVTARGHAEPGGSLQLSVTGEGIPGPMLGGAPGTRFDATVGVGGTTGSPAVDGRVVSADGEFLGVPFNEFSARVTGADGVVRIDPLVLERRGHYRATIGGTVPYGVLRREPAAADGTLTVDVDGNPLAFLAEFTDSAESGSGSGTLNAVLVTDGESVTLASARLEARADRIMPAGLFERVDDVTASVSILDGAVVSGEMTGRIDGSAMRVRSVRDRVVDGRELPTLTAGGVDLGVLALSTDSRGVTANVPGLMLPDEFGRVALSGKDGDPELLVAGPSGSPFLWGEIEFSDLSFTYPFVGSEGEGIGDIMSDAEWSLRMTAGRNLWYWRPDANLNVERGSGLDFAGVPSEHTMCVSGRVTSTRGIVTYLHTEFNVREVSVEFPAFCEQPRFHIAAEARVADGTTISLSMHATEGVPALAMSGVTLDESALVLSSDSPEDNTPEKIMSRLQYGVSYDLLEAEEQAALERRRAVELIGTQIGLRVARPLLAPIESRIRRSLNLDLVRIDIDFVEHFLSQLDMWTASEGSAQYVPFTTNTRMTLGKYIARDWLVSYLGVVEPYEEDAGGSTLGLRSELGIEYEVSRNTSLSLRAVYDPTLAGWDRRVSIENRYEF
ncbi:MAG: translocation/assembly module TamB domain-containing protein [Candidatus Eisenbacteria bacterium]